MIVRELVLRTVEVPADEGECWLLPATAMVLGLGLLWRRRDTTRRAVPVMCLMERDSSLRLGRVLAYNLYNTACSPAQRTAPSLEPTATTISTGKRSLCHRRRGFPPYLCPPTTTTSKKALRAAPP